LQWKSHRKLGPEEFGDQAAREAAALEYMLAMVYLRE